jgi:hypothetical protein
MNKLATLRSAALDEQTLLAVSGGWGLPRVDVDLDVDFNYDRATHTAELDVGLDVVVVKGEGKRVGPGGSWSFR